VKHPFTEAEIALAGATPVTQDEVFEANRACTVELANFMFDIVVPTLATLISPSQKEKALAAVAYRLAALAKTAGVLGEPYQFQTIAGTARSIYELCADIELLASGKVADAVEKFDAFTRAARFSAAYVLCEFYKSNPDRDDASKAPEQKKLVGIPGKLAEITAVCQKHWGRSSPPRHWAGWTFKEQSVQLGTDWRERHLRYSALLGWQVHGGGAGVVQLSSDSLRTIDMISRELIVEVLPQALHTLANELHLKKGFPEFAERLDFTCDFVTTYAVIDMKPQKAGYPSKFAKKQ
jgi:hypothetical protein